MTDAEPVLNANGLCKTYGSGPTEVTALADVDISVAARSMTVITGRSGSGKTTLLNLLGGLDEPGAGSVHVGGSEISAMSEDERAAVRRTEMGFIFQAFGLLPMLTAAENVEIPLRLAGADPDVRRSRSGELLALVGLEARAGHRPSELSGGEQQRVAIARSLANSPSLILADEPTGQLDSRTGAEIVAVIARLVEQENIAVVVATHDAAPLAYADQVLELADGRIVRTASI